MTALCKWLAPRLPVGKVIYIMTYQEAFPKNFNSQSTKFKTLLKTMEIYTKQKEMSNFITLLVTILYKLLNVYKTGC